MIFASRKGKNNKFNRHFEIDRNDEIFSFFVEHKDDKKETFQVRLHRTIHYLRTGIWINEKKVCEYAERHPKQRISLFFSGRRLQENLLRYEQRMVIPRTSPLASCKKAWGFVKEYFHDSETVGAILPSTKYLAKEIVSEIPKNLRAGRRRILEIGPGTGAFTDTIIRRMNPVDTLHLVEFDRKFYLQLREKYKDIPNVKIFHRSILDHMVTDDKRYNFVISGLPLNGFSVVTVQKIFEKFEELTADGGKLSYFDYLFLPSIKRACLDGKSLVEFDAILALKKQFYNKYGQRKKKVVLNMFPAMVRHHRLGVAHKIDGQNDSPFHIPSSVTAFGGQTPSSL
jgi:phospholipid N-methyltransferase